MRLCAVDIATGIDKMISNNSKVFLLRMMRNKVFNKVLCNNSLFIVSSQYPPCDQDNISIHYLFENLKPLNNRLASMNIINIIIK